MPYWSGAMYYNTVLCSANSGPCISVCHSPCHYNSQYLAAYQNYKDCKGDHLVTCSNFTEVSFTPYCPFLSLNKCTGTGSVLISIMSTGPGCVSGGLDGCTHGHSGTVRKMGDLNRAALTALGAGSLNRIWAHNSITW